MAVSVQAVLFSDLNHREQREFLSATAPAAASLVEARDVDFDFETPALAAAFAALPLRHQLVLRLRYCEGRTTGEIATKLFLSGERIRQLESEALRKLRELLPAPTAVGTAGPIDVA